MLLEASWSVDYFVAFIYLHIEIKTYTLYLNFANTIRHALFVPKQLIYTTKNKYMICNTNKQIRAPIDHERTFFQKCTVCFFSLQKILIPIKI